jgi:hypothetical protein
MIKTRGFNILSFDQHMMFSLRQEYTHSMCFSVKYNTYLFVEIFKIIKIIHIEHIICCEHHSLVSQFYFLRYDSNK